LIWFIPTETYAGLNPAPLLKSDGVSKNI